jgi:hypothetical protein
MDQPRTINGLDAKCRVCQVSIAGESSKEITMKVGCSPHAEASAAGSWRPFWTPVGLQNGNLKNVEGSNCLKRLVGPPGFESLTEHAQ